MSDVSDVSDGDVWGNMCNVGNASVLINQNTSARDWCVTIMAC